MKYTFNHALWEEVMTEMKLGQFVEIERLQTMLHNVAEHLGNALYSDEWRTREYAIVAFSMYERAFPEHARDVDEMLNQ
jgi:hypothetical protein